MTFKELYSNLVAQTQLNHPENQTIQDRNIEYDTSRLSVTEVFDGLDELENNLSYYMENDGFSNWEGFTWNENIENYSKADEIIKTVQSIWRNYILDCLDEE